MAVPRREGAWGGARGSWRREAPALSPCRTAVLEVVQRGRRGTGAFERGRSAAEPPIPTFSGAFGLGFAEGLCAGFFKRGEAGPFFAPVLLPPS